MAKYSQAQNRATQKYIHNNYDQLSIRLPKKGRITRNLIAYAADVTGSSVNAYIMSAVEDKMVKDGINIDEFYRKEEKTASKSLKSADDSEQISTKPLNSAKID